MHACTIVDIHARGEPPKNSPVGMVLLGQVPPTAVKLLLAIDTYIAI